MSYKAMKKHDPIDPDVVLPAAIRAASARASEIHKQYYEQQEAPNQQEPTNGSAEGEPKASNTETNPEKQEAAKSEAPPADADKGNEDWQHKYNSLKPRFDQQRTQIVDMSSRLSAAEAMNANLQRQINELQQQRTTPPAPTRETSFITPEERETYGEDFLDVAARAASAKLTPEMQRLQDELKQLREQVSQNTSTVTKTTTQSMYTYLDGQVPNWRDINRSPAFLEWVEVTDPFSGVPRIKMLREAFDKGDATRVLTFFRGFLNDEAATDPAARKPETPAKGKVPLSEYAAPGRAKAPAATTPPGEKETITHAQIAQFYSDVNRGKYRGNEAEKDRLEAMIFQAQAEGRVV